MPTWIITLIYSRYRLLKEFVELKISLCLGACLSKFVFETQVISLSSQNFWKLLNIQRGRRPKVLNVLKKAMIVHKKAKSWTFTKGKRQSLLWWRVSKHNFDALPSWTFPKGKAWMFSKSKKSWKKAEGQNIECFQICWTFFENKIRWTFSEGNQKLNPINVHSVHQSIAKVILRNLSHLERAEHMERLIKEAILKTSTVQKSKVNAQTSKRQSENKI